MAGRDGNGIATGGLDGTEGAHQIAAVRSNTILSLDKAESIAARRLRELAIRLGNDDADAGTDRAPFDADRHFRERLAERMAALGAEASADEPGRALPYAVSDALPLSALGLSLPLLPSPAASATAEAVVVRSDSLDDDVPLLDAADVDASETRDMRQPNASEEDNYPAFEPSVRLVDLISQQRTLVNRLADMSLAEEVAPQAGLDVTMLDSGTLETSDMDASTSLARSDAEELFEAATHAAEPLGEHTDADALAPLAISAEQLIAALEAGPSAFQADEPAPADKPLTELAPVVEIRQPVQSRRELTDADGAERAPMIIERARAEMTAIANGDIALRPAPPSGAVGFFAGLSLSIAAGIVLFYTL